MIHTFNVQLNFYDDNWKTIVNTINSSQSSDYYIIVMTQQTYDVVKHSFNEYFTSYVNAYLIINRDYRKTIDTLKNCIYHLGENIRVKDYDISQHYLYNPEERTFKDRRRTFKVDNEHFAKGPNGKVYRTNPKKYVMKILDGLNDNELEISKYASEMGFGPIVIETGVYHNADINSYIISDEWENTILNIEPISIPDTLDILNTVENMHDNGVWHQDLAERNIMYRYNNEGEYEFSIIDYGMSVKVDIDLDPLFRAIDYVGLMYGQYNGKKIVKAVSIDLSICDKFLRENFDINTLDLAIKLYVNGNGTYENPFNNPIFPKCYELYLRFYDLYKNSIEKIDYESLRSIFSNLGKCDITKKEINKLYMLYI
jgi:tRNA A-37 threonylcarbamoyl transferase component Bud32